VLRKARGWQDGLRALIFISAAVLEYRDLKSSFITLISELCIITLMMRKMYCMSSIRDRTYMYR